MPLRSVTNFEGKKGLFLRCLVNLEVLYYKKHSILENVISRLEENLKMQFSQN